MEHYHLVRLTYGDTDVYDLPLKNRAIVFRLSGETKRYKGYSDGNYFYDASNKWSVSEVHDWKYDDVTRR